MNISQLRKRVLEAGVAVPAIVLLGAGFAVPAYAQDEAETCDPATDANCPPVAETSGDTILVTGSRIPQPNLQSASPITALSSQDVKLQGTTRTEDIINSLPQSFAAQGSNISNGATGTATVNLRGLGSVRTMVLVNGRRLMPGDPRSPVPDINFIPALAIERVEVLTGGASSVYGADAVSGVVNFIMDTDFEGLRLDGQYSLFDHVNNDNPGNIRAGNDARGFLYPTGHVADGGAIDVAAVIGAGFDDGRGHVTAYATYRKQDEVLQRDRDYSFCAATSLNAAQVTALGREFNCGGSATSDVGSFFTNVGTFQVGPNRTFIPGTSPFNFAPYNFFQRPDERYTFGAFADYEIAGALQPYLEMMFMDDRSVAQIAPSGNFFNTLNINCDNPLLSAQQRALVCAAAVYNPLDANPARTANASFFGNLIGQVPILGPDPDGNGPLIAPILGFTAPTAFVDTAAGGTYNRGVMYAARRNVEGGGRRDDLQHTDYRVVAGIRGDLDPVWSYDSSFQYGRVVFAQTYFNDFSIQRISRAIDVIDNPATPGVDPVCRSFADGSDANCVPWDIFALGAVSQGSLNYLQTPGFSRGNTQETVMTASLTGLLGEYGFQSPWAADGIAINLGAEYRKERLEFDTDTAFSTGDLAGQGGATIGVTGEFDVKEVFTEVQIPLISDRPFFEQLEFRAGYRYSDYDVGNGGFSTDTYKFEAEWAPVRDIRFRGSYNRAVRAPNIVELFSAQSVGLAGSTDPCSGPAVGGLVNGSTTGPTGGAAGFTAAQCARTGVSAAQFGNINRNPAEQYNALLGGNPDLLPETADSITLGVVLQPRFLPRFALTVDWFDIEIEDAITFLSPDTILEQCLETGTADFCSLINRAPGSGSLWISPNGFTEATNINSGGLSTRGVDVNASYSQPLGGLGDVGFTFVGTWLDELVTDVGTGVVFDCAGFFGNQCGTPNPEWRHKLRVTYTHPSGVGLSGQWRYFSAVDSELLSSDTDLDGTPNPGDAGYSAQSYLDLVVTAQIGDHYNFRIGANNVLDRIPPISVTPAPFGNGNTYPQVYDAMGRYIFAGVTLDF